MSGGHKDKTQWFTIEACLYLQLYMNRSGRGVLHSMLAQTGVSLYSGLTQCQGHSPTGLLPCIRYGVFTLPATETDIETNEMAKNSQWHQ